MRTKNILEGDRHAAITVMMKESRHAEITVMMKESRFPGVKRKTCDEGRWRFTSLHFSAHHLGTNKQQNKSTILPLDSE
jgi:hypothetical protein